MWLVKADVTLKFLFVSGVCIPKERIKAYDYNYPPICLRIVSLKCQAVVKIDNNEQIIKISQKKLNKTKISLKCCFTILLIYFLI